MSIRVRLLLSYLAMLIIPLILIGISFLVIVVSAVGDLKTVFTLDTGDGNPLAAIMGEEASIASDIRTRIAGDPDSLRDPSLMKAYDDRLQKINMGLIVRLGDQVEYISPDLKETKVASKLPPFGSEVRWMEGHDIGNGSWMLDRQYNVVFQDGSKGSFYMLLNLDFLGWLAERISKPFLLALLIILVVVNGILTYFVSRSIIRPLRSLRRAAEEIKEGNLSHPVRPESRDEIGELAAAFEEMRIKLKDSVDLQLQYEDNRSNLISNISHDLKSPVAAIRGYVEGIMDGVTHTPEMLDSYIKTIHRKTVQMDRLIDELFLFSKLDLKRLPFHFEEVALDGFLSDCAEELQLDAEKRGVKLSYEPPALAEPAIVVADREKLKRVFVNVVENAVKYADKADAAIWIGFIEEDGYYKIGIRDNGKGISAESLPHIFERFYRADPARNVDTGGSGLGLAIAQQIVEEHGGLLTAASQLGAGTLITISLKKWTGKGRAG
ncbi:Signal transduction histidine kinase [Cohnella sp. OV330]|uniref:sensor histidine kinase n=1 Tax=Cohnella sp. OV330 TaxID=1855288 RepID=UPI0008E27882|nr:HAMP domain-containing sensor histidine kinase [Cohnella sp. OV330]SFA92592.1 Signal transduction histidine kinase [Cohnella sp. OV330]